jgi:ABC-type phosphate/phosphonate transport system ATPase subunit
MGSYSEEYKEPKYLLNELKTQLSESTKNIVVIGASGAGKTLLLIKLLNNL